MSFIYRFGLLPFPSCDMWLLLWSRGRVFGQILSQGTAVRPTLRQECHRAVSAPCTLGRAWKKINMGSFAAESHGCLWWRTHSSLPACLPSDQGFSCGIGIKQVPPRDQASRMGRSGATSPVPHPPAPWHSAETRAGASGLEQTVLGGSSAPSGKAVQGTECSRDT